MITVEATDLTRVQSLTLKTDDGQERRFAVAAQGADAGHLASPGHLRQHMAHGDRMIVRFRDGANGPIATAIDDAPND